MKRFFIIIFILTIFSSGCNFEPKEEVEENPLPIKTTDPADISIQPAANKTKDIILSKAEVKELRAVELNDDLLVALELYHQYTFQSKKIVKNMKSSLEKQFPEKKIFVTTDHKFFIELDVIEQKIENKSITKNELNKELKELKKLFDNQI